MSKCQCCKVDDIQKVEFCDLLCEKCDKCDYLIFKGDQLELFFINLIHYYNIGNSRKYYNLDDMTGLETKALNLYLKNINVLVQAPYELLFGKTRLECTICRRHFI